MERQDAIALVARAIRSGIFNDLGSGSNVDICVITKDGAEYLRNYDKPNPKTYQRKASACPVECRHALCSMLCGGALRSGPLLDVM